MHRPNTLAQHVTGQQHRPLLPVQTLSTHSGIRPSVVGLHTKSTQQVHAVPSTAQQHPIIAVNAVHPQAWMQSTSLAMSSAPGQHIPVAATTLQQQPSPLAATPVKALVNSPVAQAFQANVTEQRKAVQPLQSLTNDLTSRILSQQANQWRQTQNRKGTALLDLVPNMGKKLQTTTAKGVNSSSKQAEPSKTQPQPLRAEQHCEAFIPAVQECINASGDTLCKPFYQQVVAHAVQQRVSQPTATASVQDLHSPDKNTGQQQSASEIQSGERSAKAGLRSRQADSSALSADLFLGNGQKSREEVEKAQRHLAEDLWATAVIGGEGMHVC